MQTKIWSPYQQAIFEEMSRIGGPNVIIEALAGTGKTTVLLEALKHIPKKRSILIVAFNKRIAEELQERAPTYSNMEICTLHSFGYRMVRQAFGKVRLNTEKATFIIRDELASYKSSSKQKDKWDSIFEMKRCVSLCKSLLIDTPDRIDEMMDEFEITSGSIEREQFMDSVIKVLGECKRDKLSVDFDDMVWFPFVHHLPIEQYDEVLVDEYQDLSPSQIYLATASRKKRNGRITLAGDEHQVLYSWRGVDINSGKNLQKKLSAKVLPLPISYRCPSSVIKEAQKYTPEIRAAEGAKEGRVVNILEKELPQLIQLNDFALSRTNAPLVRLCFTLWKQGTPATIRGKDLGPSLLSLITQSKKKGIPEFLKWLEDWKKSEIERMTGKSRNPGSILDRAECLTFLSEGKKTVAELISAIKSLFENKDEQGVVILSTIHGAKGLEANRVFFLTKTMFMGEESQAEKNVAYVATTRAKDTLFYVR